MIAVAVSGGVDSLASLVLLKNGGHAVIAMHALLANAAPPPQLIAACAHIGVPLHIADLRSDFNRHVLDYFIRAHASGQTPNPCAMCNRHIKFGALLKAARRIGAQKLATGHYARHKDGLLARAEDHDKDQSYFLSLVPRGTMRQALFPMHCLPKSRAREIAAGLAHMPESQDICFAESPADFLAKRLPCEPGPILLMEKADAPPRQIGMHKGLWRHTPGQRRGLGIAWREPLYVLRLDAERNAVIAAPRALAAMRHFRARNINFFVEPEEWPEHLFAKWRYNQKPHPVAVQWLPDAQMRIIPRMAAESGASSILLPAAPGQVAAIYDENGHVLCGGEISQNGY